MAMASLADLDEFARAAVTRRQLAAFETECDCTRKLHAKYARQHAELSAALVLDGSGFRWEGLGNSGTRWMGLLRFGHATGRATFLKVTNRCASAEMHRGRRKGERKCHIDFGTYFVGWGGVDWQWRRGLQVGAADFEVVRYACAKRKGGSTGCAVARLSFRNGSHVELEEPAGLLGWLRGSTSPRRLWLRLAQQDSLEFSYSKPEALHRIAQA